MLLSKKEMEWQRERAWTHGEDAAAWIEEAEEAVKSGQLMEAIKCYEKARQAFEYAIKACQSEPHPGAIKDIVRSFQNDYKECDSNAKNLRRDIPNFMKLQEELESRS